MKVLTGRRYGSLTVLDDYQRIHAQHGTKIKWKCICDCGNVMYVFSDALQRRKSLYCKKCKPAGVRNLKLYHVYAGILQRCYNTNNPSYAKYGAKGVTVCEEWRLSYDKFEQWAVSNGYHEELTIDRIDSSAGYYPKNCRWISLSENGGRANIGKHKNKTKLSELYAVSPSGERIDITNISKFCAEHQLNRSNVSAALHGRINNNVQGWAFYSNKSRK